MGNLEACLAVIAPRWSKILRDIWSNKARTLLVVLSLTLGVAATGTLLAAHEIIPDNLDSEFRAINPSSAIIFADGFSPDVEAAIRSTPSVRSAEGRLSVLVRGRVGSGPWRDVLLQALENYDRNHIDVVRPQTGAWPPQANEVLIERSSAPYLNVHRGSTLQIEMPDGRHDELAFAGTVHDLNRYPVIVTDVPLAYASLPTLSRLLGQSEGLTLNELHFTVAEQPGNRTHNADVAARLRTLLESRGTHVLFTRIPSPNEHFLYPATKTMLLLLAILGIVTLLMGGLLVVNTISALLIQQVRQIAVMKSFGAHTWQLMGMYIGMVLVFSLVAAALAIPISTWASAWLVTYVVEVVNFDVVSTTMPPHILVVEVVAGVAVPLLTAVVPIRNATRLSVREALANVGLDPRGFGHGVVDGLLGRIRGLPRPMLLSIRNAFRRKGRLAMTLIALVLGGAFFIGVLSVRDSLEATSATEFHYMGYDLEVSFPSAPTTDRLEHEALQVAGVATVESWGTRNAYRLYADNSESPPLSIIAPPAGSRLIDPILVEGRWLQSSDTNAVVLGSDFAREHPDLKLGVPLTLKIDGRPSTWRVVGVARTRFFGVTAQVGPAVFVTQASLAHTVGELQRTDSLRVVLNEHDASSQARIGQNLEEALRKAHIPTLSVQTVSSLRAQREVPNSIIVNFLLAMAALLALVGGLGLAGTTSMSVLERTREIGITRSIGASPMTTFQLVLAEGLFTALVGWAFGVLLSLPVGYWLSSVVSQELLEEPPIFSYSIGAVGVWLALVLSLAVLATSLPAWRAASISVREALAYE